MAEQLKISGDKVTAVISTEGAELKSLVKDGVEYLWEGNAAVWKGQAPLLFPICGSLKDNTYVYDGETYTMGSHGFARSQVFDVEKSARDSATFLLRSNAESLRNYPFCYELRVTYTIIGDALEVTYSVKNTGDGQMYFSIGSHEGYACPEGIEAYSLVFEKKEDLICHALQGSLLAYDTYSMGENTEKLPLKYDDFSVDTLAFLQLKSRKVSLVHTTSARKIDVIFNGFDYLFVWTRPDAKYLCIEPWCGMPDFIDSDHDITKKRGIVQLAPGKTDVRVHTIVLS